MAGKRSIFEEVGAASVAVPQAGGKASRLTQTPPSGAADQPLEGPGGAA